MAQQSEQQWAGANALGMCAFAMITMILWIYFLGLVPKENTAILFAICFSGGIAQIIAGIIELRRGVGVRGNLLATMGCLFMLIPGLSFLMTVLKLGVPVPILGYVFMLLGTFMGIWGLGFLRAPRFVFCISPLGVIILFTIGFIDLGYHELKPLAAWTCFLAMLWALWMLAHSLGEFVGVRVPVGKPLAAPKVAAAASPVTALAMGAE